MKLTPGKALDMLAELDQALDDSGILKPDGHFAHPLTPAMIAAATPAITAVLKKYGLAVPAKVDRFLAALEALPAIFLLLGLH
jgi:hypothetical protein